MPVMHAEAFRELVLEDLDDEGEAAAIASLARPGEVAMPATMLTELEALPDPLPVGATLLAIPRPGPSPTLTRWAFVAGTLIGTAVGGLIVMR